MTGSKMQLEEQVSIKTQWNNNGSIFIISNRVYIITIMQNFKDTEYDK
jgi:hypothetical protein